MYCAADAMPSTLQTSRHSILTPVLWGRHCCHPPHSTDADNEALHIWTQFCLARSPRILATVVHCPLREQDLQYDLEYGHWVPNSNLLTSCSTALLGHPSKMPKFHTWIRSRRAEGLRGLQKAIPDASTMTYISVCLCLCRCLCVYKWSKANKWWSQKKGPLPPLIRLQSKVD